MKIWERKWGDTKFSGLYGIEEWLEVFSVSSRNILLDSVLSPHNNKSNDETQTLTLVRAHGLQNEFLIFVAICHDHKHYNGFAKFLFLMTLSASWFSSVVMFCCFPRLCLEPCCPFLGRPLTSYALANVCWKSLVCACVLSEIIAFKYSLSYWFLWKHLSHYKMFSRCCPRSVLFSLEMADAGSHSFP